MGYLSDNTPAGSNHVICQDLYSFRLIVIPKFASNIVLQSLVKDEIPDVEEWQFSGRRRCVGARTTHPAHYAQNSRRMRPFTEEVVFAFHTESQRAQVGSRLTLEGFKFRLEDEPTGSPGGGGIMVIVVP